MQVSEQRQGAVTVLTPKGPLTHEQVEAFGKKLDDAFTASLGRFVLDTSQIPFIDSRGLELLLDTTEQLAQSGHALKLCGTNETVREVLALTELSDQFEHFDDVNSAVRSFL